MFGNRKLCVLAAEEGKDHFVNRQFCVLLAEEEENAEEENGEGACALVDQEGDPVFERHCWHLWLDHNLRVVSFCFLFRV